MVLSKENVVVTFTEKEHQTIKDFCEIIDYIAEQMEETYNIYTTTYDDYTQEEIEIIKCFVNQMDDGDTMTQ